MARDRRPRRRRIATVLVAALVVGLALLAAVSALVADRLTTADRVRPTRTPRAVGLPFEEVRFAAATDGTPLAGWLVRPSGDVRCSVVMAHGRGGARDGRGALEVAAGLVRAGYAVLLFDLAGHGESGFRRFSLGQHEGRDVLGAVRLLAGRDGTGCVAGLGFSTGAVALLDAAAAEPGVRAVVADSAWADTRRLLDDRLPVESRLPRVLTPAVLAAAQLLYGLDEEEVRPTDDVARIAPRPVLLVNGTADDLVPVAEARALAAAGPSTELWLVPGAEHVAAHTSRPRAYLARVLAFLDRALAVPPGTR